jgi:virginiamycin B lyase
VRKKPSSSAAMVMCTRQKASSSAATQNANYVGRINPETGAIKVQKTPTERANPYGMVFTSKGIPFVCDFGTNKIIQIDPETLAI